MQQDVLATPGHLIGLAARGFSRLSEARLKPLGFGITHVPVGSVRRRATGYYAGLP
jgi:hypothetical protein